MLVYRDGGRRRDARHGWAALQRDAERLSTSYGHDAVVAVAIETGELESGIVDSLSPDRDSTAPLVDDVRACTLAAARLLLSSRDSVSSVPDYLDEFTARLSRIRGSDLPPTVTTRPPEGFVYYSLSPRQYAEAARQFARDHRVARAMCIGIRSIGTTLSAVVTAQLDALGVCVDSLTVRPRGHPFDRHLVLDDTVRARLQEQSPDTWFAIVDEGPGLSGSSFASVARALCDIGASERQIVFFPGWAADGSTLRSAEARAVWQRHRRYPASAFPAGPDFSRLLDEVSAGRWRTRVYRDESSWPAAHPQHEVRKFWSCAQGITVRYAGLGRYGRTKVDRANALANRGLGGRVLALDDGYLTLPFAHGVPADRRERDAALLRSIARHSAFLASAFESGTTDLEPIDRRGGSQWSGSFQPV
jgi:hypothetical protein